MQFSGAMISLESPPPSIVASVGGVHKLLSLQRRVVVGIARDSFGQEADGLNGTKFGAAFETSSGRRVVQTLSSLCSFGCRKG